MLSVERTSPGALVKTSKVESLAFDEIVFACHPEDALSMLAHPSPEERRLLSKIPYSESHTVLHRDERLMPKNKNRWASWNCIIPQKADEDSFSITYNLNKIQGINPLRPVYVSLRPHQEIHADKIFAEMTYHHPLYSADMLRACDGIRTMQGKNNTWFAGAYLGSGFHEDAFSSGVDVADHINASAASEIPREKKLSTAQ